MEHSCWERATKCSSASAVLPECALWCHPSPVTQAYKAFCSWHCSQPLLNHGNTGSLPVASLGWRSHKASAASLKSGIPSTVVAHLDLLWTCGSKPHPAWPLCACPHKHTAAKAGPVPGLGAAHWDVPGALSSQSRQWWGDPAQWRGEGSDSCLCTRATHGCSRRTTEAALSSALMETEAAVVDLPRCLGRVH